MSKATSANGRPKIKGDLRNFRFRQDLDTFLSEESKRTGKDMTCILEQLLAVARKLKPAARDAEMSKALSEAA